MNGYGIHGSSDILSFHTLWAKSCHLYFYTAPNYSNIVLFDVNIKIYESVAHKAYLSMD